VGFITQSNRRGREILWVYDRRRERMDWRKGLKQIQIRVLRGGVDAKDVLRYAASGS